MSNVNSQFLMFRLHELCMTEVMRLQLTRPHCCCNMTLPNLQLLDLEPSHNRSKNEVSKGTNSSGYVMEHANMGLCGTYRGTPRTHTSRKYMRHHHNDNT